MATAAHQIVDAIATRLAGTATLITTKRLHPLAEANLPAWRVLRGADEVDTSVDNTLEQHALDVLCSGYVRAADNVDDALDTLLAAGLAAIHAVQAAQFSVRTSAISAPRLEGTGEAAMAAIDLRLRCTFATAPTDPATLL